MGSDCACAALPANMAAAQPARRGARYDGLRIIGTPVVKDIGNERTISVGLAWVAPVGESPLHSATASVTGCAPLACIAAMSAAVPRLVVMSTHFGGRGVRSGGLGCRRVRGFSHPHQWCRRMVFGLCGCRLGNLAGSRNIAGQTRKTAFCRAVDFRDVDVAEKASPRAFSRWADTAFSRLTARVAGSVAAAVAETRSASALAASTAAPTARVAVCMPNLAMSDSGALLASARRAERMSSPSLCACAARLWLVAAVLARANSGHELRAGSDF